MKSNDPYGHLVTTSFWHSIPMDFWKNSLCDYIDTHEYFGVSTAGTASHGPRFQAWNDPTTSAANTSLMPIASTGGQVIYDTAISHTGSRSLNITTYPATSLTAANRVSTGSEYHVGANPAHKYTISCWAKGTTISNLGGSRSWEKPRLCITWSRAYHENDWAGESTLDLSLGTYDWQKFQITGVTLPITANTANISIEGIRGVPGSANGNLWVDDVMMVDETTGENIFVDGGFEGDRIDYDSALAVKKYGVLLNSYGERIGKPTMMGETGIRGMNIYGSVYKGLSYTEEDQQLVDDVDGIYLKKMIWAHAGPNIPYMMMWWTDCIDTNNLWHYFKALDSFMTGIYVSNGKFKDAEAVTSNTSMRAWGQKDVTDSCAYLWIDNSAYTWKNVTDANIPASVSGTVTVKGLAAGSYVVEWWNTSTGMIASTSTAQSTGGSLVLNVSNLVSDIACKIYSAASSVPANPSSLVSTSISSDTIGLAWNDNSDNETGMQIEISANGSAGPWVNAANLSANTTAYSITSLTPLTSYSFRVRAFNLNGNSGYTNILTVTTANAQPAAPSNESAVITAASDPQMIAVTWVDNSNNEKNFELMRSTNAAFTLNVTRFTGLAADSTSYIDAATKPATMYYYRVRASNSYGASAWSNIISIATPGLTAPVAPSSVTATAGATGHVTLKWMDNSNNETHFDILRATNAGFTKNRVRMFTGSNITSLDDTPLTSGVTYYYRIRAMNVIGVSDYSDIVAVTAP
jgi:hypothetical protein